MRFRITLLKSIYFFAIILTIAIGCKRTEIPVTPNADVDIYVAGVEDSVAKVWKNGVATNLTTNGGYYGEAKSVFVSGNDVYVAGWQYSPSGMIAKVWKNGIVTILTNGITSDGQAYSVFVSGSDVYVAGWSRNSGGITSATVWKNGVATYVTNGINSSTATSIFVKGADVYLAGWEHIDTVTIAKV